MGGSQWVQLRDDHDARVPDQRLRGEVRPDALSPKDRQEQVSPDQRYFVLLEYRVAHGAVLPAFEGFLASEV